MSRVRAVGQWEPVFRCSTSASPESQPRSAITTRGGSVCTGSGTAVVAIPIFLQSRLGFQTACRSSSILKNPEQPKSRGRWWLPGQWIDGGEEPRWPATLKIKLHHALVNGGSAYLGYWDGGLIVLDISDVSRPRPVSRVSWAPHQGGCTHTALPLPGRRLLAVVDESTRELDKEPPKYVRLMDITDERVPKVLSWYRPDPQGAAWPGVRFGPHNLHENRPESYISEDVLFVTCFAAGLKILDISDPHNPREIESFVPQEAPQTPQLNDVFVTTVGLVYVTDRSGLGLYILETKEI